MIVSAAVASLAIGGAFGYFSPHATKLLAIRRLRSRCRKARAVILTYDDGPSDELTPALLSLLQAHGAIATFFVLGRRAAQAPTIVDRIVASGHELGCHSQNHRNAWHCAPWTALDDVNVGYRTLERWIGPTATFRPPYGKTTLPVVWQLRRRRTPIGWWTIDSGDTYTLLPTPDSVVEAVCRDGGGVVLMHDFDRAPANRDERHSFVLETTRRMLLMARRDGLRVMTLGQLPLE